MSNDNNQAGVSNPAKTMKNIAIYARYSSDLQNVRSCADQIQSCRDFVAGHPSIRDGRIKTYYDEAMSGKHMKNRPGINKLLKSIETGQISHVVAEGIDRISRSQEHIALFHSICQYHRVEILTVMEGPISDIHIGLKGTMSAVYLTETAHRVRRGHQGNIREGKAAGGLPYGYKVKHLNDDGQPESGLREIDSAQALVVKRIYDEYCDGLSPFKIARALNDDGIPSPRGGLWTPSTIRGHYGRGNGILQNAIYKGEMIWNRSNFERHPVTGVRHRRQNESEEWVYYNNPSLVIIAEEQWEKVQKLIETRRSKNPTKKNESYPDIGFKVICSRCGKAMNKQSAQHLICGTWKRVRACDQNKKINTTNICVAAYQHLDNSLDTIWTKWQHLAENENESRRQQRQNGVVDGAGLVVKVITLDFVSRNIFVNALASAENEAVLFIQKIIAEASIDTDNDGNIIINDLLPEWSALEDIK